MTCEKILRKKVSAMVLTCKGDQKNICVCKLWRRGHLKKDSYGFVFPSAVLFDTWESTCFRFKYKDEYMVYEWKHAYMVPLWWKKVYGNMIMNEKWKKQKVISLSLDNFS